MTPQMPKPRQTSVLLITALLAGCAVGPNYVRPSTPISPTFKEAEGWVRAQPDDAAPRGDWWTVLGDPVLNQLESQVEVSNQNLAAAEAAYRQARASVSEQRAALFPTISLNGSAQRSERGVAAGQGAGSGVVIPGGSGARNSFQLAGQASWEPDLWGKIRRTVEAAGAQAQASNADLANARLSAQSTLATDYIAMRADDELKRLLDQTVDGYQRSLTIATNQYNAGLTAKSDLLTAQSQLAGAQAQSADLVRQRAQMEHAIAVLTGQAPANVTIAPAAWTLTTPDEPAGIPSLLLQRRPDIASAERKVAAANAQIGVQEAAYFPSLTLTGQGGYASSALSTLISSSASFWSLGASAAETLIDFGARHARVAEAKAAYDQAVAEYRQTTLSAFQEVEDALAAERVLAQEEPLRAQASQAADQSEQIALNQYKAGTTIYTTVVVAQTSALSARQSLLTLQRDRITAAVQLVTALGGGWAGHP